MGTKWRAMFGVDGSNDIVIENITLWNPSPQLSTNGQSETLRVEGGARTIVRNATIKGLQDTLLMSGQVYVANSIIEGDTDFIWGNGIVYFDRCEIKAVTKQGYNVQARNAIGRDRLRLRRLQPDRRRRRSRGTGWRGRTRTRRRPRRWSRTSTARWARTSIRRAG